MNKDIIKITKYDVLDKLPDPFIFENGDRVNTKEDWNKRKKEIYNTAVEFQYGTMPPNPEFLEIEELFISGKRKNYRIITGTKENPVIFSMYVFLPNKDGKFPVIIDGDMCFNYAFSESFIKTITENDIAYVLFDRTELAPDRYNDGKRIGQMYKTYPEYTFGALGAWAWGYSRCVDALEKLDITDLSLISFTGHSRGGKTALLAGVLDERAAIVNPNATCAGSGSCYRLHIEAETEDGDIARSETLNDLATNFPFWIGPEMLKYKEREKELPFDCHFLKAMVAPRILFLSEAASDIWSNPVGSWQTTMAATEVYKFLNAEENVYWYFRPGYHYHDIKDLKMLISIIRNRFYGDEITEEFFKTPFEEPDLMFDFKNPKGL
ncbi:MAG: hypothetical protein WCX81_00485 [Monoglobales bacterium]